MPAQQTVKGRNVRVEIGATYGAPKTVTAVTNASPGVASSTAHGLLAGAVGYFQSVAGMAQLEGQAIRVGPSPSADSFTLQGLNTTSFPVYGSGQMVPVLTWLTLAESTAYTIGGGDAQKLDETTLLDVIQQQSNGLLAAQTLSIKTIAKTIPTDALAAIEAAAQSGTKLIFRITHLVDGAVRIGFGEPSFPGEDVQQGAVGTGSLEVSVKGYILKLAA